MLQNSIPHCPRFFDDSDSPVEAADEALLEAALDEQNQEVHDRLGHRVLQDVYFTIYAHYISTTSAIPK